jgi:hypothetical protein
MTPGRESTKELGPSSQHESSYPALMQVMAGRETAEEPLRTLEGNEVKLAYGMGEWASQVTKLLHDV